MKKKIGIALALAGLMFAGCGSEESDTGTTAAPPSEATAPTGTNAAGDVVVNEANGDQVRVDGTGSRVEVNEANGDTTTVTHQGDTSAVVGPNGESVVQDRNGTAIRENGDAVDVANDGTTTVDDGNDHVVIDPNTGSINVGGLRINRR